MHCFLIWSWYGLLQLYVSRDIIGLAPEESLLGRLNVKHWRESLFHIGLREHQLSQRVILFLSHRFKSVTLTRFCAVLLLFSVDFLRFHDHFVETGNKICWSSGKYTVLGRNGWRFVSNDIVDISSDEEYSLEEFIFKVQVLPLVNELFWKSLDICRNA